MKVWVGHTVTSSHYLRAHGSAIMHRWKTPFGKQCLLGNRLSLRTRWCWSEAEHQCICVDRLKGDKIFLIHIKFNCCRGGASSVFHYACIFFFLVPNLFPTSMLNTSLVDLWPLIFPWDHSEFLCLPTIISRKSTFVKPFLFLFSEYFWQILGWNNKTWHKMSKVPTTTAYIKFSILSKKSSTDLALKLPDKKKLDNCSNHIVMTAWEEFPVQFWRLKSWPAPAYQHFCNTVGE